jgi:predicted TIM-barrel fold metal-dependent hydrolase
MTLEFMLENSYVSWCKESPEQAGREVYLDRVRHKSYFRWLWQALKDLYGFDEPLSAGNWDEVSSMISRAYQDENRHIDLMKNECGYEKVILDAYWSPGSDNGYKGFFTPAFRINMFMYGYDSEAVDYKGTNARRYYNMNISDIDEYIGFIRERIIEKKNEGCVSLKCASAYDRTLDFVETTKDKAQRAFRHKPDAVDIKAFQDYVYFEVCKIAAELDLPFQNHTGLGLIQKSNAMNLEEAIRKNPQTKFILFHGSYPWMEDTFALAHYYPNVYPDMCWLPIISETAAKYFLSQIIEVSVSTKICWGCDTRTSEEGYGALLAMKSALSEVFARKIADGYLDYDEAVEFMDKIMYKNAKELYRL